MKYRIFGQTVERILIKKQINVLLFIIISFVFSQFSLSAAFVIFPSLNLRPLLFFELVRDWAVVYMNHRYDDKYL